MKRELDLENEKKFKEIEVENLPAGMEEDFSHLDLQTEALYPRAIRSSVTIFLNSSFLLQILLFFSTIFEISANKFLSATLAQGIKLYKQKTGKFKKRKKST